MRAVLCTGIVSLSACSAGLLDWFGINSSCFIFLYVVVLVSLILNYTTAMRRLRVMGRFNRSHKHGVSSGHSWNAFTYLTGEVSEPTRNSIDVRHVSCGWQLND